METGVSARRRSVVSLFIALGLVAVSCSDHESPTSPRAAATGKATISGTLLAASEAPAGRGGASAGEPVSNATVRIPSTGQAAQTDASGRFTLADVEPGLVNLEIRGAGVASAATVSAAPGAITKVTVTVNRGHSTVTLGPRSDGAEGTVVGIAAPNFMLQRKGGTVTVQTNADTKFRSRGNLATFADLKVGQRAEVEGAPQADGSILAARVTLEDPEDEREATKTPPPTVTGTPPAATATRTPKPDDDDRTKPPTVTGTRTPKPDDDDDRTKSPTRTPTPAITGGAVTGTPTATRTPEPEEEEDIQGTVGSVSGSSFVVMTRSGSVTVQTTSSTRFRRDGGSASIADLKTGGRVEVRGQVQPDSSVLASRVDINGD